MRMLFIAAALIATTATPAIARERLTGEQQLQKLLKGHTPGKPVECISLGRSQDSTTIDQTAIVYHDGDTLYVNRFNGGCPELRDDRILVTRTPSTRLCRGDIARIMERPPSIMVGTCSFDSFTPYKRVR